MYVVTHLGVVPASLCTDQHDEGFDVHVAWHCAIFQVVPAKFHTLSVFTLILKSGALLVLLIVDVVR